MKGEYLSLVKETLLYIYEEYGLTSPSVGGNVNVELTSTKSDDALKISKPLSKAPEFEKEKPKSPMTTKEKAMGEMLALLKPHLLKPAHVYIAFLPEDRMHQPFLESLAQAINDHFTSSMLCPLKSNEDIQHLLETPYLKFLLIPSKGKKIHELEGKILYLATLADYQNDIELKRSLWKKLKSLLA